MTTKSNGDVYFQSIANSSLYLTGSSAGGPLTLQPRTQEQGHKTGNLCSDDPPAVSPRVTHPGTGV